MGHYRSTPRGIGNLGMFGDGVDVDLLRAGNRAQRRYFAKHEQQQARKDALAASRRKQARK
ncbi:MAG: hypothetical protein IPH41_10990 [Sulfuritalea sp.]|nr:hypothetical protein [Sulfuritalea sp.]